VSQVSSLGGLEGPSSLWLGASGNIGVKADCKRDSTPISCYFFRPLAGACKRENDDVAVCLMKIRCRRACLMPHLVL